MAGVKKPFQVSREKSPEPEENFWQFTGKLGQNPWPFKNGGQGCFVNLFRPAAGKGTCIPVACFGELGEKVRAEFQEGDWMKATGYFHSYRDFKAGILKHQMVLHSFEHVRIDEASFRAKEAASLEGADDPLQGLFD